MEHSFNIELAKEFGIEEAIIINNLFFWISKNIVDGRHYHDGKYWTYGSIKALHQLFPYMSEKAIRGAIQNLIKKEIIITGNYNKSPYDRTLWYAFTEKGISVLQKFKIDFPIWVNQNDQEGEPIPDNKHIEKDIYNNIVLDEEKENGEISKAEKNLKIDKDNFELIWEDYPRKDGKTEAFKKYRKWVNEGKVVNGQKIVLSPEQIDTAVRIYKKEVEFVEKRYIKQGSTFFGDCLLDYIEED